MKQLTFNLSIEVEALAFAQLLHQLGCFGIEYDLEQLRVVSGCEVVNILIH